MLKIMCVLSLLLVINAKDDDMDIENKGPYRWFSSRTPYELVSSQKIVVPDGYTPQQIFTINRHGTSHPEKHSRNYMLMKLTDFTTKRGAKIIKNARLSSEDIQSILNWIPNKDHNFGPGLHQKGQKEIKELAQRIKNSFSTIFSTPFNDSDYTVNSLPDERCEQTGLIFLQTIFNNNDITSIPVCHSEDKILMQKNIMSYDSSDMKTYIDLQMQQQKIKVMSEMDRFKSSEIMANVVQMVRERLGLDPEDLDPDLVFFMYDMCTHEGSPSDNGTPVWCKVFSDSDLEVLEYVEELYMFNTVGYGNDFHPQLAAPMYKRLLVSLQEKVGEKVGENRPKGVFYFANTENVLSMYVALNLGRGDQTLNAENYRGMKDLSWRTSKIGPWAANFMAVLYKDEAGKFFVAFYFNEQLTTIKVESGNDCQFCSWNDVEEKLELYKDKNLYID
ncbi:multiple inositol polyphosphate phosphatase 1-like [Adelges cooleyi]|uniref:multiple inositol polyphosphate phosphatase 1-like n=1 Tax=Adelges cooleyi TaxID=133065 RepID=UPI00217F9253|nr:multiple inositol polyphosphate phosphatase 1-like [Adelges cooleyi]